MSRLILLAGFARSGKDTSAMLLKQLDPTIKMVSIASPMKNILATTFNIPMAELDIWKNEERVMLHGIPKGDQENLEFPAQTYRSILQLFGTEAMKTVFGNNVWTTLATKQIKDYYKFTDTVVITDWRFPEEYTELLKEFDITTVCILRDGIVSGEHSSENALNFHEFDYTIINNGTLEELKQQLKEIL